jgi:putative ABC transport system substrate-binding protein
MRRRDFIAGLGSTAAWPLAARAQQAERVRRVGALFSTAKDSPRTQSDIAVFRERLAMLGWVEGRNLRMDYRFTGADPDLLAAYAEELVNLRPDLIWATGGPAARAVQQRTAVIPIVFMGGGDAASTGLVGNTARPGDRGPIRIVRRQVVGAVQGGRTRLDQGRTCRFGNFVRCQSA